MPLASKKQRRYLWANDPDLAQKFEDETPKGTKLPEESAKPKPKKGRDYRAFARGKGKA